MFEKRNNVNANNEIIALNELTEYGEIVRLNVCVEHALADIQNTFSSMLPPTPVVFKYKELLLQMLL